MALLAGLLVYQGSRAADAEAVAGSRKLAAASDAASEGDPAYAALLALAANQLAPTGEARTSLFSRYLDNYAATTVYSGAPDPIDWRISLDGRVAAALSENGGITVWSSAPGAPLRTQQLPTSSDAEFALTPDGSALWWVDGGRITGLDVANGSRQELTVATVAAEALAVSEDGTRLVVTSHGGARVAHICQGRSRPR